MSRVVLVVGEASDGPEPGLDFGFVHAEIHQIDRALLDSLKPEIIISPLICRRFDCTDLAQILWDLGYDGTYRAVTSALPSPELIRQEIRSLCPGLKFDVTFFDA